MILTESRIEIADRQTTLCLLDAPGAKSPLDLGLSDKYGALYKKLDEDRQASYESISGKPGKILSRLLPAYGASKYWRRYLRAMPESSLAWPEALPVIATLNQRFQLSQPPGVTVKVGLVPQVVLYPFGWSTWLSVRVTKDHTLHDLALLVQYMFNESPFSIDGSASQATMSLQSLLDMVSAGVKEDAFLGAETRPHESSQFLRVVTVLAKHGASLSLRAMESQNELDIRTLLRPAGTPSQSPLAKMAHQLRKPADLNYILFDGLGRFIWMEYLLKPEGRNKPHLECYHQNSFMALLQGMHFQGLLQEAQSIKPKSPLLDGLTAAALSRLSTPPFKNASIQAFVDQNRDWLSTFPA